MIPISNLLHNHTPSSSFHSFKGSDIIHQQIELNPNTRLAEGKILQKLQLKHESYKSHSRLHWRRNDQPKADCQL
jgi:hypothetical protein